MDSLHQIPVICSYLFITCKTKNAQILLNVTHSEYTTYFGYSEYQKPVSMKQTCEIFYRQSFDYSYLVDIFPLVNVAVWFQSGHEGDNEESSLISILTNALEAAKKNVNVRYLMNNRIYHHFVQG